MHNIINNHEKYSRASEDRPSDALIDRLKNYSFRIAASGLSFIARAAGT